ncbi:type IV pilin protein [Neisseria sp. Ec49-e6-T10]|uniref:type IV pilin protein n=1 Tax=Neisseria sp. Ec49-e6-T10 TaxID=3140744 RepID=UPI003EB7BEA7
MGKKIYREQGWTLLELVVALFVISVILSVAWSHYASFLRNARLKEAQAALLTNASFMQRWHKQHGRYTKTSTTWPNLPVTQTEYFVISFSSKAQGVAEGRFYLKAVAKNEKEEPRYLTIDQFNELRLCEIIDRKKKCILSK